jgi:hypothetical protein
MKKEFYVWLVTKYGTGVIKKTGSSMQDVFKKLPKTYKKKDGWIECIETGESLTFYELTLLPCF